MGGTNQVWIVEDSPTQRARLATLLSETYTVSAFSDGEGLLERLIHAASPDLVLLDWQLPSLSGLEICKFIRGEHDEVTLPILMLTSRGQRTDFAEGLAAGANDFLAKPYDDVELIGRVKSLVRIRQQARTLREREVWNATTLQSIGDAVVATDAEGTVTYLNPAAESLTGWPKGEAWGRPLPEVFRIVDQRTRGPMDSPVDTVRRDGKAVSYVNHTLLVRRDGSELSIGNSASPIRGQRGELTGVVLIFRDTSAQQQAEAAAKQAFLEIQAVAAALRSSEEHMRRLIEATGAGTWELDPAAARLTADRSLRALHGLPAVGELDDAMAYATVHPEDRDGVRASIQASLAGVGGGRYALEYRVVGGEGVVRWVEVRAQAYFDAAGQPLRLTGTGVDITARKEAEQGRQGLLEALAAQPMLQVCVVKGDDFIYQMANPVHVEQVAAGRDVLGKPFFEVLPELRGQGLEEILAGVVATGRASVGVEASVTRPPRDGGAVQQGFVNFVHQPVRGAGGTFDGVLTLSQDVTATVLARQNTERFLEAEKVRAGFERQLIGIVSHDLRNPLHAVLLGMHALLRDPQLSEPSFRMATRIQASAERAVRLVKDLLDFTQARLGGGIPIYREETDLRTVLVQVVDELRMTRFAERDVRLEVEGHCTGAWDPNRLAQAVMNLASNALKYSPAGSRVSVRAIGSAQDVVLEVHNLGMPLAETSLARLFQPMQRGTLLDDPTGRSVGLGLFIVEHIVHAHGGAMEVTSTEDAGTTFRMRLPRAGGSVTTGLPPS